MTQYNYDRKCQLFLGYPEKYYVVNEEAILSNVSHTNVLTGGSDGFNHPRPPEFLTVPSGDQGLLIEDLRIQARTLATTKSAGSDPKKAIIKVHNLSAETKSKITQKNVNVILKAGYKPDYDKDNLPLILSGQVSRVWTKDSVTFIQVQDGFTPHTTVKISKSLEAFYTSPITANDVLEYLAKVWKENGVASSRDTIYYDFAMNSTKYYTGWTGEGYLKDVMDDFCNSVDLEWYITNSSLYVQPKGKTKMKELFVLDTTNLYSINEAVTERDATGNTPDSPRVLIETSLDGRIREGKYIQLPDTMDISEGKKKLLGTYKVVAVEHIIDSHSGPFQTNCECEKVQ